MLPERNYGLSLSDQYWMRPEGSSMDWQSINYFNNSFSDEVGRLLCGAEPAVGAIDFNSPDNTSDGILPKRWVIKGEDRCLLKGGTALQQEPYNELVATELYQRLLEPDEYVAYELAIENGAAYSSCKNMLSDSEELVPALYVDALLPKEHDAAVNAEYRHFLRCCDSLGVQGARMRLSKMIVCDYILANFDRHYRNFGLIRDVETLTWRIAPLFDNGSALWCKEASLTKDNLAYVSLPFVHDPELQLSIVDDFSWFEPERLYGFVDAAINILGNGPLANYTQRLFIIEDELYDRIDHVIDIANQHR
jgi:hypothetical protein